MYCENCFRDNVLGGALRELGHEVIGVPLYLPPAREAGGGEGAPPVFFGGIRVFLADRHRLFRGLPRWLERVMDSPWLLGRVAGMAGMTAPRDLAATTLSMLRGERGRQADQLEELVSWLAREAPPDVVVLSTALLAGFARRMKERLGVPVVCMLQDEDGWLDAMPEPARGAVWRELGRRAADVDLFVAVSRYYAGVMRKRLGLGRKRVRVVHPGIDLAAYGPAPAPAPPERPVIGYLSPFSRAKGLSDLVEAFVMLKREPELSELRLRAAGQEVAAGPRPVDVRARLALDGVARDVEFPPAPGPGARRGFFEGLTVFSVPAREPEAFGVHVIEALASGVPVVQPRHGAFPEIVKLTGGGVLYRPGDVRGLASALEKILLDPGRAGELGSRGREGAAEHFAADRMAREMASVFEDAAAVRRKPARASRRRQRPSA
jgi:glycosyltransferase involved in cell wall biosynthesis